MRRWLFLIGGGCLLLACSFFLFLHRPTAYPQPARVPIAEPEGKGHSAGYTGTAGYPLGSSRYRQSINLALVDDDPQNKPLIMTEFNVLIQQKNSTDGSLREVRSKPVERAGVPVSGQSAIGTVQNSSVETVALPVEVYETTQTDDGGRLISARAEDRLYTVNATNEERTRHARSLTAYERVVKVELPRRFDTFSLGARYKDAGAYVVQNYTTPVLPKVSGVLQASVLQSFTLHFAETISATRLLDILERMFGDAQSTVVNGAIYYTWSDQRTKITYDTMSLQVVFEDSDQ